MTSPQPHPKVKNKTKQNKKYLFIIQGAGDLKKQTKYGDMSDLSCWKELATPDRISDI